MLKVVTIAMKNAAIFLKMLKLNMQIILSIFMKR